MNQEPRTKNKEVRGKIKKVYASCFITHNSFSGFTLIELLVVISIISILTAVASVSFMGVRSRTRDGVRKSDIRSLQSALEQYRSDTGGYPQENQFTICKGSFIGPTSVTYIKSIPCDPNDNTTAYGYSPAVGATCQNTVINGATINTCNSYILTACLENANDSDTGVQTVASSVCLSKKQYQINNP